jgi:hypothetical protein
MMANDIKILQKLDESSVHHYDFLSNPIPSILKEISKKVEGEQETIKAIILTKSMDWVKNKEATSANLMVGAISGSGKDHVTKNTLSIFPKENALKRTRISPTTLTYWHYDDPTWTWDGKSLYLEDISESVLNCPVFKVMASGETTSTIVKEQKAIDIQINGKPTLFITTAASDPNNEMLRRFPIVKVSESVDQTEAIKERQAMAAATGESLQFDTKITEGLRSLKRVKVLIPFAPILTDLFPSSDVIIRTAFQRFLDYIKGSAALHQKVRKCNKDGCLIATADDYNNARACLISTITNSRMVPIARAKEKILELFENGTLNKGEPYTTSELVGQITWVSRRTVYDYLNDLADRGFLKKNTSYEGMSCKPVYKFQYVEQGQLNLPEFNKIKNAE